jgi:hypothetical protein
LINIQGLDKREVLKALFDAAIPKGNGWRKYDRTPMRLANAGTLLKKAEQNNTIITVITGRQLHVDLSGNEFDPTLYNQHNGEGAAEKALEPLLTRQSSPTKS